MYGANAFLRSVGVAELMKIAGNGMSKYSVLAQFPTHTRTNIFKRLMFLCKQRKVWRWQKLNKPIEKNTLENGIRTRKKKWVASEDWMGAHPIYKYNVCAISSNKQNARYSNSIYIRIKGKLFLIVYC